MRDGGQHKDRSDAPATCHLIVNKAMCSAGRGWRGLMVARGHVARVPAMARVAHVARGLFNPGNGHGVVSQCGLAVCLY